MKFAFSILTLILIHNLQLRNITKEQDVQIEEDRL